MDIVSIYLWNVTPASVLRKRFFDPRASHLAILLRWNNHQLSQKIRIKIENCQLITIDMWGLINPKNLLHFDVWWASASILSSKSFTINWKPNFHWGVKYLYFNFIKTWVVRVNFGFNSNSTFKCWNHLSNPYSKCFRCDSVRGSDVWQLGIW